MQIQHETELLGFVSQKHNSEQELETERDTEGGF